MPPHGPSRSHPARNRRAAVATKRVPPTDRSSARISVRPASSQPKPCIKVGDRWYQARVQITKQTSSTDVSITLDDILAQLSTNNLATFKVKLNSVEVYLRGHPSTGIYASLNTSLLASQHDTNTNNVVSTSKNDSLEAEDFGSGNNIPGIKFTIPCGPIIAINNSGETKNEGTVITARPVGAKSLLDSIIVCCVSLDFQPY